MMEKMIFGRYIPGDSILHRLGPALKISVCIWLYIYYFPCE